MFYEIEPYSIHNQRNWRLAERLDTNNAKGQCSISNKILKNLASLSKSLLILINTSAHKASFSTAWKQSEIIPIYKEGDKQRLSN